MFHRILWRLKATRSDEGSVVNFIGPERGLEYKGGLRGLRVFRFDVEDVRQP